jgi:type IV secretion system protein VirB10
LPLLQNEAASSPLEFAHLIRHDDAAVQPASTTARTPKGPQGQDSLSERLQPTELTGVSATRLKNPELTIAQGTIIPCIEQTALDSSYPGLITAVIPQDTYSVGGHTVLIDAGSKVVGTMQKGIINGLSREFVLWQQITTPAPGFVRIALDSPAADALGRTGLDGDVNRHIWEKLEGALLLSTVDTGIQAAALGATSALANRSTTGNNLNFYQFQGYGDQAVASLLQSTITIPDTLTRPQGASCSIFVARDLDFSSVYSLRFSWQH